MIRKFHIYLADLDPSFGAEAGKLRPVVVVQTDDLNSVHPTTLVCPITSKVKPAKILRLFLPSNTLNNLSKDSDVMIDQVKCIDIRRIKKHLGQLDMVQSEDLMNKINIVLS